MVKLFIDTQLHENGANLFSDQDAELKHQKAP